jgi:hypothetical protein
MIRNIAPEIDNIAFEPAHELRNPLAFVHVELNLTELRWAANLDLFFRRRAPKGFGAREENDAG